MRDIEHNTPHSAKEFDQIEQNAVRWFTRINHGDCDPETVEDFFHWLEESKEHQEKYDAICGVMEDAREFTDDPLLKAFYHEVTVKDIDPSVSSTIREKAHIFTSAKQKVMPWQQRMASWWGTGQARGAVMASLAAIAVMVVVQLANLGPDQKVFQTAAGEIKSITLEDGSVIKLNTKTRLTVEYSEHQRRILLEQGQATFSVAKAVDRPFVVLAGRGQVTAVGTEFDIFRTEEELQISLIEGKVRVREQKSRENRSAFVMEAGKMHAAYVTLSDQGISKVTERDPIYVTAWQQRKIIFDGKSLSHVIQELNRYSGRPIILGDARQKDERITAIFPTDVSAALVLIKKYFNLVESPGNEEKIVLVPSVILINEENIPIV